MHSSEVLRTLTRSSLHRCLQRHGISRLPGIEGDKTRKKFRQYPIGYFHIDIAAVRTEEGKLHLLVAIDRTAKFVYAKLHAQSNRRVAVAFLPSLIKAVPYKIHTIPTDNGIQFCHLPRYRNGSTARYITHMFDLCCREHGIGHRTTKVNHPWTNGQAERMNRTIKEATIKRYHYSSGQTQNPLAELSDGLQLRQASQDSKRSNALRIHLQNMV